jgi:hypothetical protein
MWFLSDFRRHDKIASEFKDKTEINGAAWEIARASASDDELPDDPTDASNVKGRICHGVQPSATCRSD